MTTLPPLPCIVGALACQRDSYLRSLDTEVVSCTEYAPPSLPTNNTTSTSTSTSPSTSTPNSTSKSKPKPKSSTKKATDPEKAIADGALVDAKTWLIEFRDSVLFPEGGGQPTDHGTVTPTPPTENAGDPIPLTTLQRHGLRCVAFSPKPIAPGTPVRQDVDFNRRWDLMQQHTGQHLLSAVMDTLGIDTVGWAMGSAGDMNYVELSRKPSEAECRSIQERCIAAIRENLPITVETPGAGVKADSLPDDYDKDKGVVRFIKIGDLDYNACCGTHLKQTAHISLILLHHTQSVRGTNCRLFFSCGDRAIKLATSSIASIRSMAVSLSSASAPTDVESAVKRLGDSLADSRRKEKKLLCEIAQFEGARIKADLASGKNGWCHRPAEGLDFLNQIVLDIRDTVAEKGVVVLASGQERETGAIMIVGEAALVDKFAAKVKELVSAVKGGGKGKWQGKVAEWKKGELDALKKAVQQ